MTSPGLTSPGLTAPAEERTAAPHTGPDGGEGDGGDGDGGGRGGGGGGNSGRGGDGDGHGGSPDGRGRRRSRTPVISAIAVACVTALLIAVLATGRSADDITNMAVSPLNGKPAPDIVGPPLDGHGSASLSGYRGKWVLVNFFASWCVPCQQEQGDLVRFQNTHAALGDAVIFGVRFDDPDVGPITALMSRSGGQWPIVDAPNAKIEWGVTGPPESFLVDPSGLVLVHVIGKVTAGGLEQVLSQAKQVDVSVSQRLAPSPTTPGP